MENPDVRVEARFKNARLFKAMERVCGAVAEKLRNERDGRGALPLVRATSLMSNVPRERVSGLLNLRESPVDRHNNYRKHVVTLAEALGSTPDELFPLSLYTLGLPRLAVREVHSTELLSLRQAQNARLLPSVSADIGWVREENVAAKIASELHKLSPRQEKIITLRFGLNGNAEHTLEELAQDLGITRERVRMIEAGALKQLRKPRLDHSLTPLIDVIRDR